MNFKPTKLKIITAVIVFVIVDLFLALVSVICMVDYLGPKPPNILPFDFCFGNFNALQPVFLTISLVIAVIVYLIYSLVQKK